jgi:glycosyltransferase involved in cell wall biosynthesis
MHVLHLSATGTLGGAERSLLDILASVREAYPEWPLSVIGGTRGRLEEAAAALGAAVQVLPFGSSLARLGEAGRGEAALGTAAFAARLAWSAPSAMRYLTGLRDAIDRIRPAVVHTHGLKMHILAAWAVGLSRAGVRPRVVWHVHDYVGNRQTTARLLRWSLRHCDAVVANSASVASDVRAALQPGVPVVPVHNAVDLQRFTPDGARLDLDRLAGLPPAAPGTVRVGLMGTFGRWKGHTVFLDAIARAGSGRDLRAYVIGGALYDTAGSQHTHDELRRYADMRGLSDRVGFTGFVDSPDEAIRALDVVVHASIAPEPFGLVIAEAMACGRAVIASDAGGAREIFTDGVDALAHTPGDADTLAARIVELSGDPDRRDRLGRAGRRTAERRFNRDRLAGQLAPIYHGPLRAAS